MITLALERYTAEFISGPSLYSETPVVYTTGRSKAVVPMLFLFCVAL